MPHTPFSRFSRAGRLAARTCRGVVAIALGAAGLALAAQPSHAQILARPTLRLSAGVIPPPDGDIRRNVGSPYPFGLAEISVPQVLGNNTYIGIGYGERRRGGNQLRTIPIMLTRLYAPENAITRVTGYPYGGAGIALYRLRGRTDEGDNTVAEEKTAYGFTTILGYQLPGAYFVEARYNAVTGSARGMSPGGLWVMVGLRL